LGAAVAWDIFVRQHVVAGRDRVAELQRVLAADRLERQAEAAIAAANGEPSAGSSGTRESSEPEAAE
jgi:hypothetical protein